VSLAKRVDGVVTPLNQSKTFEVYALDGPQMQHSPEALAFQQRSATLQRAILGANAAAGEAMERIQLLKRALEMTPGADPTIGTDLLALEDSLRGVQEALNGDPTPRRYRESSPPSLMSRLRRITGGVWSSTLERPGGNQRRQYEIIAAVFGGILEQLRGLVEGDLVRIENAAEAAGAPWTSGRMPTWRP
jgi:hypothetical protein